PVWATESGFWRVPPDRPADLPEDRHPIEALLADPSGHLSLYVGAIGNGRIDLVSDLIARTPTAADVTAASRLYGYVGGDLMWAWDLAAFGEPVQSYASARLSRGEDEEWPAPCSPGTARSRRPARTLVSRGTTATRSRRPARCRAVAPWWTS